MNFGGMAKMFAVKFLKDYMEEYVEEFLKDLLIIPVLKTSWEKLLKELL